MRRERLSPLSVMAAAGLLGWPGIVLGDDILVGCWQTNDVRRFGTDGTDKGIFIPAGTIGLTTPDGLALDRDGNVLVASAEQRAVLKFTRDGVPLGVFASANLTRAGFCAFGPDSLLYVCDANSNAVRRYDGSSGAFVDTFVVGGTLTTPAAITWWNGQMLVSSFGNNRINRYDAMTGTLLGVIGTGANPIHSRVGADGLLYVSEYGASRITRYDLATGLPVSFFGAGMNGPIDHLILPDNTMLVASWNNRRILRFNADGTQQGSPAVFASFAAARPNDLLLLPDVPAPGSAAFAVAIGLAAVRRHR